MQWVAITHHTTSEHGVSSITTADAHTSAASSRTELTPPGRFKWTRLVFRRKTKSGFCACAITFQLASTFFYALCFPSLPPPTPNKVFVTCLISALFHLLLYFPVLFVSSSVVQISYGVTRFNKKKTVAWLGFVTRQAGNLNGRPVTEIMNRNPYRTNVENRVSS